MTNQKADATKKKQPNRRRRRRPKGGKTDSKVPEQKKLSPQVIATVAAKTTPANDREKRYNTLDEFLGQDEIQQLPNTLKISKLADNRTKDDDQVVISTSFSSQSCTFFFDVHDLKDGSRNLTIIQSPHGTGKDQKRQQILLSRTDLPQFLDEFRKVLGFFIV